MRVPCFLWYDYFGTSSRNRYGLGFIHRECSAKLLQRGGQLLLLYNTNMLYEFEYYLTRANLSRNLVTVDQVYHADFQLTVIEL